MLKDVSVEKKLNLSIIVSSILLIGIGVFIKISLSGLHLESADKVRSAILILIGCVIFVNIFIGIMISKNIINPNFAIETCRYKEI